VVPTKNYDLNITEVCTEFHWSSAYAAPQILLFNAYWGKAAHESIRSWIFV